MPMPCRSHLLLINVSLHNGLGTTIITYKNIEYLLAIENPLLFL